MAAPRPPQLPPRAPVVVVVLLLLLLSHAARPSCAGPWDLSSFKLCSTKSLQEICCNASGVTYMPETNTLWIVVNNPPGLYEYTLEGELRRQLALGWLSDPEDVVYVSSGRVAVVEEPPWGGIRVLDITPSGGGTQVEYIPLDFPRTAARGAEGLSYDPGSGTYYVAQEGYPKAIYTVRKDGNGWSTTQLINGDVSYNTVGDLAAVNYVPSLNQLYVLSQESSRVLRSEMSGQVLQYLDVPGPSSEGLHLMADGKTMVVVGEPNVMMIFRAYACE